MKSRSRIDPFTTRRITLASSDLAKAKALYRTKTPGKYAVMASLRETIKAQTAEIASLKAQLTLRVTSRVKATPVYTEKVWPLIEVEDIGQPLDAKWLTA